jgi:uncharacterized protein YndB with AHSA1/START domain
MTMHTIENSTLITTTPARVLTALTTKEGIRGWWTTDCDADCEKHEATFRFDKQDGETASTFRLDSADERGVAMTCIRHDGDWLGTKLVFKLSADGDKTRVDLVHSGYPAKNELYEMCVKGWGFFLGSLKQYLETGKGEPHVRKNKAA